MYYLSLYFFQMDESFSLFTDDDNMSHEEALKYVDNEEDMYGEDKVSLRLLIFALMRSYTICVCKCNCYCLSLM